MPLIKVNNDIFFTAYAEDYSRQLFKLDINGEINNVNTATTIEDLKVYPNPSSNQIQLAETLAEYTIYDMKGQVVSSKRNSNISKIEIPHLSNGKYIIFGTSLKNRPTIGSFIKI